jgi:aspartate beta-hydroxylase
MSPPAADDPVVGFLRQRGADGHPHAGGRTLLDHLIGTAAILRRWGLPPAVQRAGLIHSVYGTETYRRAVAGAGDREEVAAVAGADAERLAHLFAAIPRALLFAGTHRWARGLPGDPARDELDAVIAIHIANLAEQAAGAGGTPGRWLSRAASLGALLADSDAVAAPRFTARIVGLSERDEVITRARYLEALAASGTDRVGGLALAAAACPAIPEPCLELAVDAFARGDGAAAAWAEQARDRLTALGTTWDKRASYDALAERIEQVCAARRPAAEAGGRTRAADAGGGVRAADAGRRARATEPAGRGRFQRYLEALRDAPRGAVYPDLVSRPWHDPGAFPVVADLEGHFDTIREEILALDGARFHRESEPIERTGAWDVAFFWERGRRNDAVCAACPVTARAIDAHATVRTLAGLSYVSRMRAGTHIEAHRGPTNLRLRCHLPIVVPDGDCAIRVDAEARRWEVGRCLVFDDFYEHEAWNRSAEERVVLIVDVWHPDLSAAEVRLLESLHGYAAFHAGRLQRYWSANAASVRLAAGGLA